MDESQASVLLGAVLSEYARWPMTSLEAAVGRPELREVVPPNGARFQVSVTVDRLPSGGFHVSGRIADGRGGDLRRGFRREPNGQVQYVS